MLSEYSKFKLKRRWRRFKRRGQQHADDFQRTTQRHVWRRVRNLRAVRRFLISWWLLWAIMFVGVGTQLAYLYRSYGTLQAVSGGIYTEGIRGTISNINPLFALDGPNVAAAHLIFNGLLRYDGQGQLVGDLAESWTPDASGRIYTVKLRSGVLWHDGTPLTSQDVVYTYAIVQHPDTRSPFNISWRGIEVSALDEHTVVFQLPNSFAPFPHALTSGIVPSHILEPLGPSGQRPTEFNQAPIGTGPFVFDTLDSEQGTLTLGANDQYFRGRPALDRFVLRTYATNDELVSAYRDGILDAIAELTADELDVLDGLDLERTSELREVPTANATFALFNTSRGVLKDKLVRQALVQSVNRNEVFAVYDGRQALLGSPLQPHQLGYDRSLQQLPLDTKSAAAQLDKAGWRRGADGIRRKDKQVLGFTITTQNRPDYEQLSLVLEKGWEALGAQVEVQLLSSDELQASHIQPHSYDVLLYTIHLGADPDVFAFWHSTQAKPGGFNFSEYKNALADDGLEAGRTRFDPQLRAAKYGAFLKAWRADAPAVGLVSQYTFYLQHPDVRSFDNDLLIRPAARYGAVEKWTVRTDWK